MPPAEVVLRARTADAAVAELVRAATDYVQRATGCRPEFLDRSEESLAFVDHYIQKVREQAEPGGKLQPAVRTLAAAAMGVYLGEVMRGRFGGRWLGLPEENPRKQAGDGAEADGLLGAEELPADPRRWRLQLGAAPVVCDPIGMAAAALRSLDELEEDSGADEVGFSVPSAYTVPLHEALARVPPVELEYFYSLTGRLETLSYAVEILVDLQQKEAELAASEQLPN